VRMFHEIGFAPSGAVLGDRYVRDWSARYVRDMAGRVIKVVGDAAGRQTTLWEATGFDGAGRLKAERFGNGVTGAYDYDDNGQTSHVGLRRGTDGPLLYDVGLRRNQYGAVIDATDTDGAGRRARWASTSASIATASAAQGRVS
jgi:hypothetical protein